MDKINGNYITSEECVEYLLKNKICKMNKKCFKDRISIILEKNSIEKNIYSKDGIIYIKKEYLNNSVELFKNSIGLPYVAREIKKTSKLDKKTLGRIRARIKGKVSAYQIPLISLDDLFIDKSDFNLIIDEVRKVEKLQCMSTKEILIKVNKLFKGIEFDNKEKNIFKYIIDNKLPVIGVEHLGNFSTGNLYPKSTVDNVIENLYKYIRERRVKLINMSYNEYFNLTDKEFDNNYITLSNEELDLIGGYGGTNGRFRDMQRTFEGTNVKAIWINRGSNFVCKKEYEEFLDFKNNYINNDDLKKFNTKIKINKARNNGFTLKMYKDQYYLKKDELDRYLQNDKFDDEFSKLNTLYDKVMLKIKYNPHKKEEKFPQFMYYFKEFVRVKNGTSNTFIYVSRLYNLYNILLDSIFKDLRKENEEQNNEFFERSIKLVSSSQDLRGMIIQFINYLIREKNFDLNKFTDEKDKSRKEPYTKEEFIELLIKLIDIVGNKEELKKLYRNWNLSSCVTYIFMHYCVSWRKTDLIEQLPTPNLHYISGVTDGESFIEWLESGNEITYNLAKEICKYIEEMTEKMKLKANKNKGELNCVISDALTNEIALLLCINEANRQIHFSKYKKHRKKHRIFNGRYVEHKSMQVLLKDNFNIDLELILNGSFENVRMNKGFLINVKEKAEELGVAYSYYIAQISRGHISNKKLLSETTKIYLQKDISKASVKAFATGTMGSIAYTLLSLIDDEFRLKSDEEQIKDIRNLNMTPYSIEKSIKKISNKIGVISREIDKFIKMGGYKKKLLSEILFGSDCYGIEYGTKCLIKITREDGYGITRIKSEQYSEENVRLKWCPLNRKTCIDCSFMIALRYFIYEFEKKFNIVLDDFEYAKTELDREIAIESINELYLPVATDLALVLGDNITRVIDINRYLRLAKGI